MRIASAFVVATFVALVVACGGAGMNQQKAPQDFDMIFSKAEMDRSLMFGDRLMVRFKVTNKTATKRLRWDADSSNKLRDEFGNLYNCTSRARDQPIDPGQTVDVFLAYEIPMQKAKHFTLVVDCRTVLKEMGTLTFEFDRPADLTKE